MVRGDDLSDGATGVVADECRALDPCRVEEVDDDARQARRRQVGLGAHR